MSLDLIQLAKNLVAMPSETQMSNAEICDVLTGVLKQGGFEVERLEYVDENNVTKANLVARRGEGSGGLAFCSHIDTVPGQEAEWPAFDPQIREGRLYGRGSCDMKGPLAATVVAAAGADLGRLRKPLYIIVTADEETGCHGAKHVAQHSAMLKETPPDYGIIAEPTRLRPVYAHKGFGSLKITATGKAAHTSTGLGESANFKIAPFLAEMAELNNLFESDESFMNREFSPPTNGFNMTLDDGGCKMNVTASKSICRLSFRVMPDARPDDVVKMVKTRAEQYGLQFSASIIDAFFVSPQSEIVQTALQATNVSRAEAVPYGTDGIYLQDLMALVILGPGDIAVAHTVGESIAVAELERAVVVYSEMIERLCG